MADKVNGITKEILQDLYVNKKYSTHNIGKIFDVYSQVILKRLREYQIPIRAIGTGHTINIQNKIFGKLKVIEKYNDNKWLCLCDCGNQIIMNSGNIRRNKMSCGCSKRRKGKNHPLWTGYEEISGSEFKHIISHAKTRGLEFSITIEFLWDLFLKQNRKCALSGVDIKFSTVSKGNKTASLDRIDSSKGYIEENVQWVHKDINIMKQDMPEKQLIKYCELIYKNSLNKRVEMENLNQVPLVCP